MRTRVLITLLACLIAGALRPVAAHDPKHPDEPDPSPNATLSQVVGHTTVSMRFGRPGVKGRKIWGELVPYNGGDPRPWVAGANGSTTITFEHDVMIDGKDLGAGTYGLHMIPSEGEWTLILSTDSSRFGIMKYTPAKDALRITARPEPSGRHQEWLTYEIEKTGAFTADINLYWEKIKVGFTIETPDVRKN